MPRKSYQQDVFKWVDWNADEDGILKVLPRQSEGTLLLHLSVLTIPASESLLLTRLFSDFTFLPKSKFQEN